MTSTEKTGSLTVDYAKGREQKKSLRYRLWRRTYEVLRAIEQFTEVPVKKILDLGTAEGRMLETIRKTYPGATCIGVEYDKTLISYGKERFPELHFVRGDIQDLSFEKNTFEVAVATAVIEHVPDPSKALRETKRVLAPGGLLVLTAPDPFWEHLATKVGHLEEEQHQKVMGLHELEGLITEEGFFIIQAMKFMVSPVGIPFEFAFERFLRRLHLNCLMANQLIVARC